MGFSSPTFLFLFLPLLLIFYFGGPRRFQDPLLLVASLFFYAWGNGIHLLLLLASIALNTLFGILLSRKQSQTLLLLTVGINLAPLLYFKYSSLAFEALQTLLNMTETESSVPDLPIGLSFFTFQAISYLVDVYRNPQLCESNPLRVGLYISLFFQLLAGPIVRFKDIREQLVSHPTSLYLASEGVTRFAIGLSKKVLLADTLGLYTQRIFSLNQGYLTCSLAWLGAVCLMLTIYLDFSGYSDMAVGLGKIFGFRLPENFRYPFVSLSLSEFWTRWHMSLTAWFRDYLFFPVDKKAMPLRISPAKTIFVLLIAGLWHGGRWEFLIFGLVHGAILSIEIWGGLKLLAKCPRVLRHVYCLLILSTTFTLFHSRNLDQAFNYLLRMFGENPRHFADIGWYQVLPSNLLWMSLSMGILASLPIMPWAQKAIEESSEKPLVAFMLSMLRLLLPLTLILLSFMRLASRSYQPFFYFQY